jgi:hypothetical protein
MHSVRGFLTVEVKEKDLVKGEYVMIRKRRKDFLLGSGKHLQGSTADSKKNVMFVE